MTNSGLHYKLKGNEYDSMGRGLNVLDHSGDVTQYMFTPKGQVYAAELLAGGIKPGKLISLMDEGVHYVTSVLPFRTTDTYYQSLTPEKRRRDGMNKLMAGHKKSEKQEPIPK